MFRVSCSDLAGKEAGEVTVQASCRGLCCMWQESGLDVVCRAQMLHLEVSCDTTTRRCVASNGPNCQGLMCCTGKRGAYQSGVLL